jgi:glycosyltransferase involved in cell wall biosynthesis
VGNDPNYQDNTGYPMKIIHVGKYPPPYGGVSVHIQRLTEFLLANNQDTLVINTSWVKTIKNHVIAMNECKTFFYLLFRAKKAIVHFHIFTLKLIFFIYLVAWKHKVIISFHNERFPDLIQSKGKFIFFAIIWMLKKMDRIIMSNTRCAQWAESLLPKEKICLLPAFIPPLQSLPLELDPILHLRKKHRYIIASNAWKISFWKNQDLYGIDILIEMMNHLVNRGKMDVILIFLLSHIGEESYLLKMQDKIKEHRLKERFIFITEPLPEASSLWNISDLVIRATNTDGNSVSVLEALHSGIPVLASDCVERPGAVQLFKNRDLDDLIEKVQQILVHLEFYKNKVKLFKITNNAQSFLDLYKKLIEEEQTICH